MSVSTWKYVRRYWTSALLIALVVGVFALSWVPLPFAVVHGTSMVPTYQTGDLVLTHPVNPSHIHKGEIIVVNVPQAAQQQYGYPKQIIHRVIAVHHTGAGPVFRTKGDNTNQDPFLVSSKDVVAKAGHMYPRIGYIVLYLRSKQGKLFLLGLFVIEFAYSTVPSARRTLGEYIDQFIQRHSPSHDVAEDVDEMKSEMHEMQQSTEHFAEAMDEYATHLESHTEAVRNLAEAAENINQSVEKQQELLTQVSQQSDIVSKDEVVQKLQKASTRGAKLSTVIAAKNELPAQPVEIGQRYDE